MKTLACTKDGDIEGLVNQNLPIPVPDGDEILIKVHATAITQIDNKPNLSSTWAHRLYAQLLGLSKPKNPIPGMVVAGEVVSKGPSSSRFEIGDCVFGICSASINDARTGSYPEYVILTENCVIALKPDNLSFAESAAMPYGGILAIQLINRAPIEAGDRVLIYGADGSIGAILIQLAKNAGAHVTSVCSGDQVEPFYNLGSDVVISLSSANAELLIESYKYFFDADQSGESSSIKVKFMHAISNKGKYIAPEKLSQREGQKSLQTLKRWAEMGIVKPVINQVYTEQQLANAYRYIASTKPIGTVIIRFSPSY